MILVTGATGTVGSEVLTALLPGHAGRIRALTRNADAEFPDGVEKVVADLGSTDLIPVLGGVDAMFLLSDGLRIVEHDRRAAAAAQQTGVRRIVKLSALSVGHGSTVESSGIGGRTRYPRGRRAPPTSRPAPGLHSPNPNAGSTSTSTLPTGASTMWLTHTPPTGALRSGTGRSTVPGTPSWGAVRFGPPGRVLAG